VHGDQLVDWGTGEELLAGLIDQVAELAWLTHGAHFKGPHPRPKPVRRPWDHQAPALVVPGQPEPSTRPMPSQRLAAAFA
jgi:hypothetical protein